MPGRCVAHYVPLRLVTKLAGGDLLESGKYTDPIWLCSATSGKKTVVQDSGYFKQWWVRLGAREGHR